VDGTIRPDGYTKDGIATCISVVENSAQLISDVLGAVSKAINYGRTDFFLLRQSSQKQWRPLVEVSCKELLFGATPDDVEAAIDIGYYSSM
jgi:hypothetical protein